jgi:hypothetical protein
MKKGFCAAAALVFIGVAICLYLRQEEPGPTRVAVGIQDGAGGQTGTSPGAPIGSTGEPGRNSTQGITSQAEAQRTNLADRAGQLVTESSADDPLPPETALQNVGRAIRQYGKMFGGNPVGTNPEITGQLNGNNPTHISFITAEAGMQINADGALVDAWGTPYFFHQISGSEMEIHSAGPDHVMWTSDDLVAR